MRYRTVRLSTRLSLLAGLTAMVSLAGCLAGIKTRDTRLIFSDLESPIQSLAVLPIVAGDIGPEADANEIMGLISDSLTAALTSTTPAISLVDPGDVERLARGLDMTTDLARALDEFSRKGELPPALVNALSSELDVEHVMAVKIGVGSGDPAGIYDWGPDFGFLLEGRIWDGVSAENVWAAASKVSRDTGALTYPNSRTGREEMAGIAVDLLLVQLPR